MDKVTLVAVYVSYFWRYDVDSKSTSDSKYCFKYGVSKLGQLYSGVGVPNVTKSCSVVNLLSVCILKTVIQLDLVLNVSDILGTTVSLT